MKSFRLSRLVSFVFVLVSLLGLLTFSPPPLRAAKQTAARPHEAASSQNTAPRASTQASPLLFVENVGQFDPRIRFQATSGSALLTVQEKGIFLAILAPPSKQPLKPLAAPTARQAINLKLEFVGAQENPKLKPFRRATTRMSYYLGDNPDTWRADVPAWEGVRLKNLYPKIDLVLTSKQGQLTPRLVARKGADLSKVQLRIEGAQELKLVKNGLRVQTAVRAFTLPLFQVGGKKLDLTALPEPVVQGNLVTAPFADKTETPTRELTTADDTVYQTVFGGDAGDFGNDIAVDAAGNAYITGSSYSANFQSTANPIPFTSDAFVMKLNSSGSVVQTTNFGGTDDDQASGVEVDANGNAYVVGATSSPTFPSAGNALGSGDGFVVKVNADGSLGWARLVGGNATDSAGALVLNGSNLFVAGATRSTDWGAPNANGAGFTLQVSTNGDVGAPAFLNIGSEYTAATGITANVNGNVWVTGVAGNLDNDDVFVQNLAGGEVQTFGGSGIDASQGIALDANGNAYVVGLSNSSDFGAGYHGGECTEFDTTRPCYDAFVTRLGTDASVTTQMFGGSGDDRGFGVAVNTNGEIFVVGDTTSSDWLTPQNGALDGFVLRVNSTLTSTWTRTIGGGTEDSASGVAADASGAVYVAGFLGYGSDVNGYGAKLIASIADSKQMNVYIIAYPDLQPSGWEGTATDYSNTLMSKLTEGTRYHGYSDPSAIPYLNWVA